MLERAFQDLNRLRQIAATVAKHGFGSYLERTRLRDVIGKDPAGGTGAPVGGGPLPEPDRRTAARFRTLLTDLGPTFIKFGQILSTRPDLLPAHWIEELEGLQDDCPPSSFPGVREVVEAGLGHPLAELFAWVEEAPLASASIAQVHRARTHAGEDVVVKVQHPDIRTRIDSDLALLHYLAKLLEAVVEEVGVYTPSDVIAEFDRTVHEELDFTNEARNARAMRDASVGRDFIVIPRVFGELSCDTVLTLERIEGRHLSEVAAEPGGTDAEAIARNLIEASFRQLFEDGLFHGDPHPGNILVLPGNRLALLDFGLVGRITRQQQEALVTLIVAVALRDPESVARMLNRIGLPDAHAPIAEFKGDIRQLLDRYLGLRLDEIPSATLARDLLDLAVRHKIKVPKEYAVLGKAAMTIEGIVRRLYPKLDILEVGMPYAKELLLARFNPSDTSGLLMKSLLKFQGLAEDVPGQLSQILVDLESGKFRVHVQPEAIDRLGMHLRGVGVTLFLGLLASALAVGGIVAMALDAPGVVGPAAVAGAAILSGVAALHHLAPAKWPKISVRRFLGK